MQVPVEHPALVAYGGSSPSRRIRKAGVIGERTTLEAWPVSQPSSSNLCLPLGTFGHSWQARPARNGIHLRREESSTLSGSAEGVGVMAAQQVLALLA